MRFCYPHGATEGNLGGGGGGGGEEGEGRGEEGRSEKTKLVNAALAYIINNTCLEISISAGNKDI